MRSNSFDFLTKNIYKTHQYKPNTNQLHEINSISQENSNN